MIKRIFIFVYFLFFITADSLAYSLLNSDNFALSLDTYFRTDVVTLKNVVYLDSHNHDDSTTYLGIDYSFGFKADLKKYDTRFYLKLERNGPTDYDAPIFIHNTLLTSAGVIERYRGKELLPQIEEFWLDAPLFGKTRIKGGLYTYEVGNAFSLNGSYENYGITLYRQNENSTLRIYYSRPELVYKTHLGPHIHQDEEQGIKYNPNAANFFAIDMKFDQPEDGYFWPYLGVLADYTSEGKRDNSFLTPVKRDILGTLGFAWQKSQGELTLRTEIARNFGKAYSDSQDYKDVSHCGYMFYAGTEYKLGRFTPSLECLISSGNRATPEMAENYDEKFSGSKNRAFSTFSPLNKNLGDSIGHNHNGMRPIVATGSGNGLQYGITRPNSFYASDLDNLIMPCLGAAFDINDKLNISAYAYYLFSFERGVGVTDGQGRYLSRDLGFEPDIYLDYKLNDHMTFGILFGYFLPGKYYKERRDDTDGSIFSPCVRGDGNANSAYQLELSMEIKF
jgi:hypothetical protein